LKSSLPTVLGFFARTTNLENEVAIGGTSRTTTTTATVFSTRSGIIKVIITEAVTSMLQSRILEAVTSRHAGFYSISVFLGSISHVSLPISTQDKILVRANWSVIRRGWIDA
jgi:hypothetical protein